MIIGWNLSVHCVNVALLTFLLFHIIFVLNHFKHCIMSKGWNEIEASRPKNCLKWEGWF